MTDKTDSHDLIHEFIYHKYLINGERMLQHFRDLNTPEYIALHVIQRIAEDHLNDGDRVYLKDISEDMELPISRMSEIAGKLRDKGLIIWEHDGDGNDGTYVRITDSGYELVRSQDKKLRNYYGKVIEEYGEENMIELLKMMKRLEKVIRSIPEDTEDNNAV